MYKSTRIEKIYDEKPHLKAIRDRLEKKNKNKKKYQSIEVL
jgi:hypothetical protein